MPLVAALVTTFVAAMAAAQPYADACGIRELGKMGGPRPLAAAGDRLCTRMPSAIRELGKMGGSRPVAAAGDRLCTRMPAAYAN